jgi:DNA repair protein RadC
MKILILFLLLTGCAAQYETYKPVISPPITYDVDTINRYLLTLFKGAQNEEAVVLYYGDKGYVTDEVVNGGMNSVAVNGLHIAIRCAEAKCTKVILAHNHPGQYFGSASGIDLENADKFKDMMSQANIQASYVILGDADANWLY